MLEDVRRSLKKKRDTWEVLAAGGAVGFGVGAVLVGGGLLLRHRGVVRRYQMGIQRAETDAETARRIAKRDIDQEKNFATQKFAKNMLQVADSLRLARNSQNASVETLREGYAMLDKQLASALQASGVTSFGDVGDPFDPSKHDALDSTGKDIVLHVHALGYALNGRVIRAASVTTGPTAESMAETSTSSEAKPAKPEAEAPPSSEEAAVSDEEEEQKKR